MIRQLKKSLRVLTGTMLAGVALAGVAASVQADNPVTHTVKPGDVQPWTRQFTPGGVLKGNVSATATKPERSVTD